jgi:hypothetical protein
MKDSTFRLSVFQAKEPDANEVSITLANLAGYRNGMFTHQLALDIAVQTLVEAYREPIRQGLDLVRVVLEECVHECSSEQV